MEKSKIIDALNDITFDHLFSMLAGCLEKDLDYKPLPITFKFEDMYPNGFSLKEQESYTNIVLKHISSNTYWQTEMTFENGNGFVPVDIKWQQVEPSSRLVTKITYHPIYD